MVMALMPTVAFAETTSYNLWVGGVEVTSDNASNITGKGITGTVTYDDSTKTLTLNNVNIDSVYSFRNWAGTDSAGIYVSSDFNGDLTIKLVGENTITGKLTGSDISSYGFFAMGISTDLIFDGSGSLNISAANGKTGASNSWSVAIYANSSVNVGAQCTITATSGVVSNISAAISCSYLTLNGAKVSAGSSAGDAVVKAENTDSFSPIGYQYIKIEFEPLELEYTIDLPVSLFVKLTGDKKPAKETFKFEIYDLGYEDAAFEIVNDTVVLENLEFDENGVAFADGIIKIKVTGEEQLFNLTEGFKVRMVKGTAKGWTYAAEQWYVKPVVYEGLADAAFNIGYDVREIVDGEISEIPANNMSFTVGYEAVTEPGTPQTGDNSVMGLWIALLVVSGAGATAIYSRKRKSSAE